MSVRNRVVAATVAVLTLGAAAPAADAGTTSKCRRSSTTGGAQIIARTSEAVVFTKRTSTYGCLYSGSIRRLPSEGGEEHDYTFSGRYVAYATSGSAIGDEFDRVYVYDLRAGGLAFRASSTFVSKIALKRNGSAAWTQSSVVQEPQGAQVSNEVRMHQAADPDEDVVLLDRGTGVASNSLALDASRTNVSWTRDGQTRTAPID